MSDAYARSLEAHGLQDVQPLYRQLLHRLKSQDPAAYDEAVARYKTEVEPAVEDPGVDPVSAWIAYGTWLAPKLSPGGSLMTIAENGLAEPAGDPPPLGEMLIYLPDDSGRRGFLLAMPAEASAAQRETAALLCG